jgi:copper chaperone CopZ
MRRSKKTTLMMFMTIALAAFACNRPDTVQTVFQVEGMHCDSCSAAITESLEHVDGVIEASADYQEGVAQARYHSRKVKVEELKAEIEKLGYTVTSMKTERVESTG